MKDAEVGVMQGHDSRNMAASKSWKRYGNRFFPISSRRNRTWLTYFELLFPEL